MLQTVVIGLGNFGFELVKELTAKDCEVIVIENNPEKAQAVKEMVNEVIVADASNRELLEKFCKDVNCVAVCIGERISSSIMITHLLKDIGVKKIIAKASGAEHGDVLKVVGAHQVIYPERDIAQRLAHSLTTTDILDYVRLSEDFDIIEVAIPEKFAKKSIAELELRNKFGVHVLAVKNAMDGKVNILPPADYQFQPDDVIIGLGDVDAVKKFQT